MPDAVLSDVKLPLLFLNKVFNKLTSWENRHIYRRALGEFYFCSCKKTRCIRVREYPASKNTIKTQGLNSKKGYNNPDVPIALIILFV